MADIFKDDGENVFDKFNGLFFRFSFKRNNGWDEVRILGYTSTSVN